MKTGMVMCFLLTAGTALYAAGGAETDEAALSPTGTSALRGPQVRSPSRTVTIVHEGQTFELANSTSGKNVETDEYVVAGEKVADWTQLITVQRLALSQPTRIDEFLAYFKKRVSSEGASLDALKETRSAGVFAVRFPASERNEEQVMICLAFVEPTAPAVLNIVQYAIKPTRVPVAVVEMRVRSWRDGFLRRAEALVPRT